MPEPAVRLRVLLVAAEAAGGIGRHLGTLARTLPEQGVDVAVCAPPATLAAAGLAVDAGASPVVAAPIGQLAPAQALRARRTLRELAANSDVMHAHGLRAGAVAASSVAGRPLVVTWHNAPLVTGPARAAHSGVARYVAHAADLTLAASEDLASAARRAGGVAVQSTFVVAPSLPAPTRARSVVRAELNVADRPLVLAVGRLQAQKRLDVLVEAAAGWAADPQGPLVAIAGVGPAESQLREQIAAARAQVHLLGARDDVADLLGAADVVALPSEWEARALVAQEALRAGVPLVTTAVGGLPELVGRAALLVPVGDPVALRAAIEQLLGDPGLRDRLVRLGLQRASTWPDDAEMARQLVAIYLDLNSRSRHS